MTGIFRINNPINSFLLFVYGILLKFVWFLYPQIPVTRPSYGFLYNSTLSYVKPYLDTIPSSYFIITYLLLFSQAVSFKQLIITRRLIQKPNYLPAMSYLLITSFCSDWNILSAPLIINTVMIWIWAKTSNLNNNRHPKSTLFNLGIALGICSFLYVPSLAFAVFIIFSLIITRPPKAAEWFITIIGILTPWYFLAAWLFLTNKLYSFSAGGFGFSYPIYKSFTPELIGLSLIIVLIAVGGFFVQLVASKQIVQVRKTWGLLVLYFIVALCIPFITNTHLAECWILALVPASAFIACAFFYPRIRIIPLIVHWLLVIFIFYMQYFQK